MHCKLLPSFWRILVAVLILGTLPTAGGVRAQGMMSHVDLNSPRMTTAELTRADIEAMLGAASGKPLDLADKGLNGLDLSGLDLTGADLRRSRLNRAKLAGARLDGAQLDMAWAMDADFTGASLKQAQLFQAQFLRARFDGADLSQARIIGTFDGGSFVGARLIDADGAPDMRNQSMGLTRASFRSARMQNADLSGARLAWADMEFAKLQGANLEGADLSQARLGGINLTGARLAGCNVTGAGVASAMLQGIQGADQIIGLDQTLHLDRAFRD
ncbi:MAG: pentapeptide repeat-containing protein [Geminicoccaceae bacterium]